MHPVTIVLLVILVILIGLLVGLYFFGKKTQKKQEEQQAQIEASKQTVSMLLHGHHLLIYGNFPLFFFATSTIRPFFWEYSQVDSVSNLSLYFAVVPV